MGRGKSYTPVQKAILKAAFAKNTAPRKVMELHPDQEFTLDGVKSMAKKYRKTNSVDRKAGSGRPKERTRRQINKVKKALEKNPNSSQRELASQINAHRSKVRRIMKCDLELKTYRTIKAQKLKTVAKQKRLEARLARQEKMEAGELNPKNVFFTDEKMFTVGRDATKGSQNFRVHVHKSVRKGDIPAEFLVRGQGALQGGVRCMVSAGVSYRGKGSLRIVEPGAKINAETYLELVKNTYETDMLRIFRPDEAGGRPNYVFQQDNAPSHTAKVAKEYLASSVPNVLTPWPANSPDFNVLDYCVWGVMETAVSKKMQKCEPSLKKLKVAIQDAYDELDMRTVKKAVKQWKKRVAECIRQAGGHFEQHFGSK